VQLPFSNGYKQFERQVYQYQHRVYGFACYLLNDAEEAEDVTQEVLLRYWNHRAEIDEERLLSWLLRVTRNACIDALRKRRSYRSLVDSDTERLEDVRTDDLCPDGATEEAEFQALLQAALSRISEPYRSIVILREVQDMKYEDICSTLDLPLNTVKVYLHRGRKMLRQLLSEVIERETT
jgi:RNA polymerase sigma factor (sigma-70 family)